jgi:hypothetical protein
LNLFVSYGTNPNNEPKIEKIAPGDLMATAPKKPNNHAWARQFQELLAVILQRSARKPETRKLFVPARTNPNNEPINEPKIAEIAPADDIAFAARFSEIGSSFQARTPGRSGA